ncbi:MAG: DUF4372 domain-containing protein [Flavobacterium sp.]|nr:DUF4372 domain-containing protein [Flavobacterium sp.]
MSSKDIEKKFVGQSIFKQLIDFIPKTKFDILAKKNQTGRYYKTFPTWTQLATIFFKIFSRYGFMCEICDGMLELKQIGLNSSPA